MTPLNVNETLAVRNHGSMPFLARGLFARFGAGDSQPLASCAGTIPAYRTRSNPGWPQRRKHNLKINPADKGGLYET